MDVASQLIPPAVLVAVFIFMMRDLKSDMRDLKADMGALKADMGARMDGLFEQIAGLRVRVAHVEGLLAPGQAPED